MPIFEDWIVKTIIHEFCHSFCNRLIDKYYSQLQKKAKEFFKLQRRQMEFMAYGSPKIMLYETLVRACVIKYGESHGEDEKYTMRLIRYERNAGFMWIENLFLELKKYDKNRDKYPTLDSFMPEIVKLHNSLNPKKMLKEQKNETSNTTIQVIGIKNGSQDVDPKLNKIIVKDPSNPMNAYFYQRKIERRKKKKKGIIGDIVLWSVVAIVTLTLLILIANGVIG